MVAECTSASRLGQAALAVARTEIGAGESGRNNRGPDIRRYRNGRPGFGAWCAAFVCYCLEVGSSRIGEPMPLRRTHGARRLYRRWAAAGYAVHRLDIMPGDLVLWGRGPRGSWMGHVGIVSEVEIDGGTLQMLSWKYIAGNEGKYPALVTERYGMGRKRLIGFARLP